MNRFFYNRYGMDNLNKILICIWLIFVAAGNVFYKRIFVSLGSLFLIVAILRMFSRNKAARYKENMYVINKISDIKLKYKQFAARKKDKNHNYFKCPNCKKYMSVPSKVGKVCIICANCKTQFIRKSR